MKITSGLALVIHGAKKKGKMQMAGDKNEEKKRGKQKRKKTLGSKRKSTDTFFISREIFPTILSPAVDSGEVTRRKSPSTIDKQNAPILPHPRPSPGLVLRPLAMQA